MIEARRVGPGGGGQQLVIIDEDQNNNQGQQPEVQSQSDLANVGVASVIGDDRKHKSMELGEV